MDSEKQITNAADQQDPVEDQQQQENTVNPQEDAQNSSDDEFEDVPEANAEDVDLTGFPHFPVDTYSAPSSAFSDESSDEAEDAEEGRPADVASMGSSEYEYAVEGQIPLPASADDFEGFDGTHIDHHNYENGLHAHPATSTESEWEDVDEDHQPKQSPGDKEFSPRTKRRLQIETFRGYHWNHRPKNLPALKIFMQNGPARKVFDPEEDPFYDPHWKGQWRDADTIAAEREFNVRYPGKDKHAPRTPSTLNPRRAVIDDLVEEMSKSYVPDSGTSEEEEEEEEEEEIEYDEGDEGEDENNGDDEKPDRDSPVSPLSDEGEAPLPESFFVEPALSNNDDHRDEDELDEEFRQSIIAKAKRNSEASKRAESGRSSSLPETQVDPLPANLPVGSSNDMDASQTSSPTQAHTPLNATAPAFEPTSSYHSATPSTSGPDTTQPTEAQPSDEEASISVNPTVQMEGLPSKTDSSTQTDLQPEKKPNNDPDYLAVANRWMKDAKVWEQVAGMNGKDRSRYRKERDEERKRTAEANEALKAKDEEHKKSLKQKDDEYKKSKEDTDDEIKYWREEYRLMSQDMVKELDRIDKLEEELSKKCEECVKKDMGGKLGDIEDLLKLEDAECCKGRWIDLEKALGREKKRSDDLADEKKKLEEKIAELEEQTDESDNSDGGDENAAAAERERKRQEAEANRKPLRWDLDLANNEHREPLAVQLADWINKAHALESTGEDSDATIDPEVVDQLLDDENLTFSGFANVLAEQVFIFRPNRLAQFIEQFYRDRGLAAPPAILYASRNVAQDPHEAAMGFLEEAYRYNRGRENDDGRIFKLEEHINVLVNEANSTAEKHEQTETQFTQRMEKLTQDLADLQQQLDECREHREAVEASNGETVLEKQNEIEKLREENERLTKELADAIDTLKTLEANVRNNESDLADQLARCREHGKQKDEENENLRKQIGDLTLKYSTLKQTHDKDEESKRDYDAEWEVHLTQQERALEDKDRRIRDLEVELETVKERLTAIEEEETRERETPFDDGSEDPGLDSPTRKRLDSSNVPEIQEPPAPSPSRPTTPPPPASPAPPSPFQSLPKTPLPKPAALNPTTPIRTPLKGPLETPKNPSTPGGFNQLLGYRPEGWRERDARWRQSPVAQQVYARLRDRAIQQNAEEDAVAELRRQAYEALTGKKDFAVVAREEREVSYRRLMGERFPSLERGEV